MDVAVTTDDEPPPLYTPLSNTPQKYAREPDGVQPPLDHPPYKSTALRHPRQPLVHLPHTITEITGPALPRPPGQATRETVFFAI